MVDSPWQGGTIASIARRATMMLSLPLKPLQGGAECEYVDGRMGWHWWLVRSSVGERPAGIRLLRPDDSPTLVGLPGGRHLEMSCDSVAALGRPG